jgi:asparagine synthase (glutamine-hydrolysing)
MNAKIQLVFTHGGEWFASDNLFFKGYLFDKNGQLLRYARAVDYLRDELQYKDLKEVLKEVDGLFSVIIKNAEQVTIGCDNINYVPVFYTFHNGTWHISDSWHHLQESISEIEPNLDAFDEFLAAGFVQGHETLSRRIQKTRAGAITQLYNDGSITQDDHYFFLPQEFKNTPYDDLRKQCGMIFSESAQKLVTYLNGRMAVVPLSGGYDSRLIVCMLKAINYKNVLCITYGRDNPESRMSKKVANTLGYPWYFVDYEEIEINGFLSDPIFKNYHQYAGNGFAMPYLQEYYAAKEMMEKEVIPRDAVFLPGHSGDYLGGSYVHKVIHNKNAKNDIPGFIARNYFWFVNPKQSAIHNIRQRVDKNLFFRDTRYVSIKGFYPEIEDWDVKEKLSKFIFNSSHVFNFFGYDVFFPLWQSSMVEFFRKVPFSQRMHKKLYDDCLETFYFKPLNVYWDEEELNNPSAISKWPQIKRFLKKLVPGKIRYLKIKNQDWVCYYLFTGNMQEELEHLKLGRVKKYNSFNAIICRWYLARIFGR